MRRHFCKFQNALAIYLNHSFEGENVESKHIKVELQHKSVVKSSQSQAIKIRKLQKMEMQIRC